MTAVEDSNEGYHWGWDESTLKDKLVGAKFYIEQSEYDGKIYDPTKGDVYRVVLDFKDDKVLRVRGYLGPFSKSLYWEKLN